MLKAIKINIKIILILLIGFLLRSNGINWDQGFHLHPDERMLIMVAARINFFNNLNPDFFNYGSLPMYLLKGSAQLIDYFFSTRLANYDGMLYLGRTLSAIADTITMFLIYLIALKLFSIRQKTDSNNILTTDNLRHKNIALFSSFFYAIAFFPIQNSHFFVVDVFLTFFTTLLVYLLLKFMTLPLLRGRAIVVYLKHIVIIGIVFAAMMGTKFTSIIFLPIIILVIMQPHFALKTWASRGKQLAINLIIFTFSFLIFNFLFMPYAFLDFAKFKADILAQVKMNSDPYIFPYTLQYVGSIPYLYYLKNIFLWGLGPIISVLSFAGFFLFIKFKKTTHYSLPTTNYFVFLIFYILYFFVIGRSAVKFMRYMLPVYPFLTIMAGYGIYYIMSFRPNPTKGGMRGGIPFFTKRFLGFAYASLGMTVCRLLLLLSFLWSFMFINIYSQKHTRITATDWILKNIPRGSTLAVEHWDDRVPIYGSENYNFVEMTLYELPDNELKWSALDQRLEQADYIILASNRLYVPLQKLKDCRKYKVCYPLTAKYYEKLFSENLGFTKIKEFNAYPKLEIGPPAGGWKLEINDSFADESFTVYDHPKVIIFKK